MKVKAGKQLINVIRLAYESDQPVLLTGRHGVGKSELVAAAAKEMKVGHIVRDLSLMEPPDLAGLPVVESGTMRYAVPSFLPTRGKGLLALEELNRAQRYLQAPCLQLLTARCLNDYSLPKGWLPIACINPAEEGYITDELDAALASRFLKVEVEADVSEWLAWAKAHEVDQRICEYVSTLRTFNGDSNPRAWTYASRILRSSESIGADEDTLMAGLTGVLGAEYALSFLKFSGGAEQPAEAQDIIERYAEIRPLVQRWKTDGRLDLLGGTLHRVQSYFQSELNWQAVANDPERKKRIKQFVADLPGDLRRKAKKFFQDYGYSL